MKMKTKTYNSIIDGTIEAGRISLCFVAMYLIVGLVVAILSKLYSSWVQPIDYMSFVLFASLALSLPLTIIIFYIRKAKDLHNINEYRNFWLCFATELDSNNTIDKNYGEINEWIEENTQSLYLKNNGKHYFLYKCDAIAFKMRWG